VAVGVITDVGVGVGVAISDVMLQAINKRVMSGKNLRMGC